MVDGQCPCKPSIEGRDCSRPAEGFYVRPLDEIMLEAEDMTVSFTQTYSSCL